MIQERVKIGGLMRCCTQTLAEYLQNATEPSKEGQTLDCKHEQAGNAQMIFRNGAWEWNHD